MYYVVYDIYYFVEKFYFFIVYIVSEDQEGYLVYIKQKAFKEIIGSFELELMFICDCFFDFIE